MIVHISKEKSKEAFKAYVFGSTICGFCILGTILIVNYFMPQIKPMDVYQGKTILKYEIVNGEIVDSCVIWKDK